MSAPADRWRADTASDTDCWDCGHAPDEHVGTRGACVAYVVSLGRETFCLCRCFVPDDAAS